MIKVYHQMRHTQQIQQMHCPEHQASDSEWTDWFITLG